MTLSDAQRNAARRLGQDVCVVAGPGSGKTRVLIERFAWLVLENRISPARILAITFTEKAATEIKERMVKEFAEHPEIRQQIERAYVSTIHGFCARLLRENAIDAQVDPLFNVLDEASACAMLSETADHVLEGLYARDPDAVRRLLRSLAVGTFRGDYGVDLASSLTDIYGRLRIAGQRAEDLKASPPDYRTDFCRLREIAWAILQDKTKVISEECKRLHDSAREWARRAMALSETDVEEQHFGVLCRANLSIPSLAKGSAVRQHEAELRIICGKLRAALAVHWYAEQRDVIVQLLGEIDRGYRARKRAASALDFDDLEEATIRLLQSKDALRVRVRDSFEYILMDELQDTNPLQWRLMELVRGKDNFFAVGDINQSIYGFRHADPALFTAYRDRVSAAGQIVDELRENYRSRSAVLEFINGVFTVVEGVETHTLVAKTEFAPKAQPSAEVLDITPDDGSDAEATEARWVARRITELVGELGYKYGDFAILTRANNSTGALQAALDEFGVPSLVVGGQTFFDTREVRDVKLLLDVLVNPCNEVSLAGLLRSPMFGVSDDDLLRMRRDHGSVSRGVDVTTPAGWETIVALRAIRNVVSPDLLVRRVLDECGYENGLTERARANIAKLLGNLRDAHTRNPRPLADAVAAIGAGSPEAEAPPADIADAVRLMTLHKAKGLEFKVVFLPFLHRTKPNGFPRISYSREHGLGIKWRDPAGGADISDCVREENKNIEGQQRCREENRLLYVGMTRAEQHLVLSWSKKSKNGSWASVIEPKLAHCPDVVCHKLAGEPQPLATAAMATTAAAPFTVLNRPEAVDQSDSVISVTDVSRFLDCPRKYYLARYLRWQKRPRALSAILEPEEERRDHGEFDAGEIGRQVHSILAGETVNGAAAEATDLADRFTTSTTGKRAIRSANKAHEWDFVMSVDDVALRGVVDLWFEHNRELTIVDYKTDSVQPPIDTREIAGHVLQVQIYATAIERAFNRRPAHGLLYFLRPNIEHKVDMSPLACSGAIEVIREFLDAQRRLDFPLREGAHCRRCEFYRGMCPAGNHSVAGA